MLAMNRSSRPARTAIVETLGLILALTILTTGCVHSADSTPQGAPPDGDAAPRDALGAAFDELAATLVQVEADIRRSPSFGSEAERVGGYRHLLRSLAKGLEAEVIQDADYPWFRILDFWLREGGDNPDQRYAFTPIRGGETYRVWGSLGTARRVELQLYAGRPWDGSGRSAGFLAFEDIELTDDGGFEILLAAEPGEGNTLVNPPEATTLFVRHIYDEWTDAPTGDVHIDRVGYEGRRRPPETEAELAARIRQAAVMFGTSARTWPAFVQRRYVEGGEPNTVRGPYDTYALGGARGRWMGGGYFELDEGEALIVRMPETPADYQAIQLTDMWFASLEHANQVSSLTSRQSVLGPDGAFYYVISPEDPGHANWLDSGALRRGTFLLRWDGVQGDLDDSHHPAVRKIRLTDVPTEIPGFESVSETRRETTRRERRRHLQRRAHR